jgi:hypothetical protein
MKKEYLIVGALTLIVFTWLGIRIANQPVYVPVSDEVIAHTHCHYYEDEATPTPAPKVKVKLPSVEWSRATLRKALADFEGVPVDEYTPMPCTALRWENEGDGVSNRKWIVAFSYEGRNAFLQGYDDHWYRAIIDGNIISN